MTGKKELLRRLSPYMGFAWIGAKGPLTSPLQGNYRRMLKEILPPPDSCRPYQVGDPMSKIDWKAYGRTEQLIVRERRTLCNKPISIIIDNYPSMHWPRKKKRLNQEGVCSSKFEIATRIAFNLYNIYSEPGNKVTLWLREDQQQKFPSLGFTSDSRDRLHRFFQSVETSDFDLSIVKSQFRTKKYCFENNGDLFLISDHLQEMNLESIRSREQRFCLIHTLSSLDLDSSWMQNSVSYFDDHIEERSFFGEVVRKSHFKGIFLRRNRFFEKVVSQWVKQVERDVKAIGGEYRLVTDETPVSDYLLFLKKWFQK